MSTRDKKRHTISFDNLTFDQFGDNPGAVVREKEQRPTLPEMFVGTDEPYSMKPGSRRSVHLGDLSGSKSSVSVFGSGEFQKPATSEDKSSKRKSYRSEDFKNADLKLDDQSPRTTGMSHSDSLPAMLNNPRKLEELDSVLQKNLNGPPSLKKDASKKSSKDKKDKEAKEKDKADKKKAKTLSEEMSKKLSKQQKTTTLPSLMRSGSTSAVGPGSVGSIAEEDEGPKTMPNLKNDKKDKLKRSGSSIKNPGVIYDLADGKLVIVAGTEEKLIKTLVDGNYTEPNYVRHFFMTLDYFTTPHQVLDKLLEMFHQTIPAGLDQLQIEQLEKFKESTQAKVIDALLMWIDFFEHFLDDKSLLDKLVAFIKSLGPNEKNYTVRLAETLKNKLRPPTPQLPPAPESHVPEQIGSLRLAFMDFHPMEIARQLTLQDQGLLIKIKSSEFHKKRWAEADNSKLAPNLAAMIDRFNKVSYWVATEIVFQPELKKRIEVIKRWIVVAESFRSIGNFNGVMQICGGLHLTSIQRLKKTWKATNKKFIQVFEALTDLMSNKGNYKAYREAVAAHPKDAPYIPYLGVILKDLTFMEDGNDDKDEDSSDMFNFDKLRMISEVLAEINRIQRIKYNFNDVKPIQDYIDNAMTWALEDSQLGKYAEKLEGPEMHAKGQMTM